MQFSLCISLEGGNLTMKTCEEVEEVLTHQTAIHLVDPNHITKLVLNETWAFTVFFSLPTRTLPFEASIYTLYAHLGGG